jgi:hypothetical protein
MPGRNQPRSSRGRSAIARKAINTNSTNGMMYQGSCFTLGGQLIKPCRDFGGNKKAGSHPSATGFIRARPWQMSIPATKKNYVFRNNGYLNLGYKQLTGPTPVAPTMQPDDYLIIGPYLQLITNLLWQDGNTEPYVPFIMNIQYYNQNSYYTTYRHLFSDTIGGAYRMPQASSINAIYQYFKTSYKTTSPEAVLKTIILGKPINTHEGVCETCASSNGSSKISDLRNWLNEWDNDSQPPIGGYMFWSAGYLPDDSNASTLVKLIGGNPENKVIYIGSGSQGIVYGANTCASKDVCIDTNVNQWLQSGDCINNHCEYQAWMSDPSGDNVKPLLKSYADASFNILILSFWNYHVNSDWVSDWADIGHPQQLEIINDLHKHPTKPKILVSGGGANGSVGPDSNVTGTVWGSALAKFAIDNHLDGVDLDLEGGLLGTWWDIYKYKWVQDAIVAIQTAFKPTKKIISFAPIAPLCANPIVTQFDKYTCNQTTGACKVDPAGTQTQAACAASCKAPVEKDSWYFLSTTGGGSNGVPVRCGSKPGTLDCASDNGKNCKWNQFGIHKAWDNMGTDVSSTNPGSCTCGSCWSPIDGSDPCTHLRCDVVPPPPPTGNC